MKKLVLFLVLALATSATAAEKKVIGVVDVGDIVRKSEAGKAAAAVLDKKSTTYQEAFKAKEKELEKLKQTAQAKATNMTAAQRAEKEKEFVAKVNNYQRYIKNAQKEMLAQETELTGKIIKRIEDVARDYGKKQGFVLVTKKDGVIMADESYEQKDITAEVMKALDAKK